jgi:hypothetical protein
MPTWTLQSSDEEAEFNGFDEESSEPDEKDDEEAELERLVFGTSTDFRQDISQFAEGSSRKGRAALQKIEDVEADEDVDLDHVDDADVRKYATLERSQY